MRCYCSHTRYSTWSSRPLFVKSANEVRSAAAAQKRFGHLTVPPRLEITAPRDTTRQILSPGSKGSKGPAQLVKSSLLERASHTILSGAISNYVPFSFFFQRFASRRLANRRRRCRDARTPAHPQRAQHAPPELPEANGMCTSQVGFTHGRTLSPSGWLLGM